MTGTGVTGSDCDKFGNTSVRRRELWVHLEVSPKYCGNNKLTLRDACVRIDIHWEDCRRYLTLLRMSTSNPFPSTAIMMHGLLFIINFESY